MRLKKVKCWVVCLGHNNPSTTCLKRHGWEALWRKGPGNAGWQPAKLRPQCVPRCPMAEISVLWQKYRVQQGRDCPPVFSTDEATPQNLHPVLGPSTQGRHWRAGACPEKGNRAGEGSGAQVLWGGVRFGPFSQIKSDGTRGNGHELHQGRFRLAIGKHFLHNKH